MAHKPDFDRCALAYEHTVRARAAYDQANAERAAAARAKHEASIERRRRNAILKEHESTIAQLASDALAQWKKVNAPRGGTYYRYDIKKRNATIAVAKYSPKIGYVVDDNYQDNDLGWITLDTALSKRFSEKELWSLPDIPGWSKSHLLTGEEHLAEMKREALQKAKPRATSKIADKVADQIVEEIGPKMQDEIASDLGLPRKNQPIANPESKLQFKKIGQEKDIVRYGEASGRFELEKNVTGGEWQVVQVAGKEPKRFDEIFSSFEEAQNFASLRAFALPPVARPNAAPAPAKPKGYVRNAPGGAARGKKPDAGQKTANTRPVGGSARNTSAAKDGAGG